MRAGEGFAKLGVDDIQGPLSVDHERSDARLDIWRFMQNGFLADHHARTTVAHKHGF